MMICRASNLWHSSSLMRRLCTHSSSLSATTRKTPSKKSPKSLSLDPNNPNPCSDFLTKECGIPYKDLKTYIKRFEPLFNAQSLESYRSTLRVFHEFGFSLQDIKTLVTRCPRILVYSADTTKAKLHKLQELGMSECQVIRMAVKQPIVLTMGLNTSITPNIQTLTHIFKGKPQLFRALHKYPSLLIANIDNNVIPSLGILRQFGISDDDIQFIIAQNPTVLRFREDTLKSKLSFLRDIGLAEESSKSFSRLVMVSIFYSTDKVKEKVKNLEKLGFDKEEIRVMFVKCPALLYCSYEKLQKNMGFLVTRVGYPGIVKNPVLLRASLENNLQPRYEVLRCLKEAQTSDSVPKLESVYKMTEKAFLDRYVHSCSNSSSKLLQVYNQSLTVN